MSEFEGERIAKVIARAGICSRRDAERLIAEGRVTLNGDRLKSAAVNVTVRDSIVVNGKPLPREEETRLWLYHKPAGLVVSNKDPEGRPTVFQKLRQQLPRVVSIGRRVEGVRHVRVSREGRRGSVYRGQCHHHDDGRHIEE